MYKQIITLLMTMTCAGFLPAQVINYDIDAGFDTGDFYQRGAIHSITSHGEEEFLITGGFQSLPGHAFGLSKIGLNGEILFDDYSQGYGPSQVQPYLGNFLTYGSILYYRTEFGTTVQSFTFEFQKDPYNGVVTTLASDAVVLENSNILVSGVFYTDSTDLSPTSIRHLCMIDSTGDPVEDFTMIRCEPFDARIHTIDTLSTGEYIIAGSFTHVNGHPANNIAKLNADFTVDTSFANIYGPTGSSAAIIDSFDRIWLRTNSYLITDPDEPAHFVRQLASGEIDTSYDMPSFVSYFDENQPYETGPSSLLVEEDGSVIFVGNFVEVNDEYHKTIVQTESNGSIIEEAFETLGADEADWPGWSSPLGPIAGTWITEIHKLPDGKILLGGQFSSFGGEPYSCLVRLQPSGYVGVDDIYRGTFSVYPNPAHGAVTVDYSFIAASQNTVLNVFDYLGRQVYSEVLGARTEGKLVVNTNELPDGVYILEVNQDGIQVEVNKLVIAH